VNSVFKEIDMFNILCAKANALYLFYRGNPKQYEYLTASFETYRFALNILDVIRENYLSKESQMLFTGRNKQKLLNAMYVLDGMQEYNNAIMRDDYFALSERLKGFVLYTSQNDSKIKDLAGIPDSLLNFEHDIQRELSIQKTRLQKIRFLDKEYDSVKIEETENRVFHYTQLYDSLIEFYQDSFPDYFRLKHQFNIPSIVEIQKKIANDEVIIDYVINDTLLYIITISDIDFRITKNVVGVNFQSRVIDYFRHIKKAGNDLDFVNESSYLYDKLIFPVQKIIREKHRLIIIPDEFLLYIPFETLIDDDVAKDGIIDLSSLNFLLNDFEIVYNFSVSLWWNARNEKEDSSESVSDNLSFTGFAPVFNSVNENKNYNSTGVDSEKYNLVERSFLNAGKGFQELPYSRDEVERINELFQQKDIAGKVYLSRYATKSSFLQNINESKYVHIATHGFSNDKYPELCGLAFYPDSSLSGQGLEEISFQRSDFYDKSILFSGEMYGLDISADLLVLSACETGIGKLVKGEGLLAMTRGFLFSGVDNVVFSLWKVNDKLTKDMMIIFYQEILSGHTFSNALRQAKLELIKSEGSSNPVFWSSFLLVGE
jgi:CHAT domain-containing protein